jgi:hypothetical protein
MLVVSFQEEQITDENGNGVAVKDVVIGNTYKSYFIEGSPDSDLPSVFTEWSDTYDSEGNGFPSGSYETNSELINKFVQPLDKNMISNVTVGSGESTTSFRVSPTQHILVHEQSTNLLRYKPIYGLVPNEDHLVRVSGESVPIISNTIEILDGDYSSVVLDLEPGDTFLLHNMELNIKVVTHNCFPEGTSICLSNGEVKNIEDLSTEDELLSYNVEKGEFSKGKIGSIRMSIQEKLISIATDGGESIKSTPKHNFYVNGEWKSAHEIKIGDVLLNKDMKEITVNNVEELNGEVKVYHIIDVKDDHTYFAENILVHNIKLKPPGIDPTCFSAGTRITMSDYSEKFIEDVVIGDEVLGWDGNELVPAKVKKLDDAHTVSSHARACKVLGDEPSLYTINETGIEFTPEHPFLTKDGWKSLVPDPNQEPYKTEQEPKVLKVGDFINRNGVWEEITEIRVVRSNPDERVYNLVIEGVHSYVADGIIVHNKL